MNINTNTGNSSFKPVFPSIKRPVVEQPLAQTMNKNLIDTPTHFETDYISMKWIPEKRRIDVIWKEFVGEEKVREVLLREVAMIRHTKVQCLFLDAQKFKGTNPNIPRWANEVWSQMVHDAGLKHFATVVSDKDIFAVFSLKYGMGEKLMSLVNCAVFKTVEESEIWLKQYTNPENPVYSEDELDEVMEEYKNPINDKIETKAVENKVEKLENEVLESEEEEIIETESLDLVLENELQNFDLKNEKIETDFEMSEEKLEIELEEEQEIEAEEKDNHQAFSNFEDLENHIQNIEAKQEIKNDSSDKSEIQS
ncbi:hypothetical protein Fleli_2400 [Bernardetia litoralis DSM 6794]|uniref:STAS/SEC14 domain-containing protein n=1 Tax=Bernardetia litoralis (strain ATCC 23117 / DSM 6794 / NBRC 15988 / NCIMB 1366 / Fx l1 / Sio-4) TaxID=880071 RepID=I4ALD2_BERLS|nr:hypothetical protein [Bernardetia litoralis]AFM04767.1 hypothetical protein Fleli_2400 [Bernardetia litoralis DSM 6794]